MIPVAYRSRYVVQWVALVAVTIAFSTVNVVLRAIQRELIVSIKEVRGRSAEVDAKSRGFLRARESVVVMQSAVSVADGKLASSLRKCKSHEDFPVRAGDRIAWSELRSSGGSKYISFYLPTGFHYFKYAIIESRSDGDSRRKQADGLNIRNSDGIVACQLGPVAGVYQIELTTSHEGVPTVSVTGEDDQPLCASALLKEGGICDIDMEVAAHMLAYPSEFKAVDAPIATFHTRRLVPATNLARIYLRNCYSSKVTDILLWIDSDSPPCMSAIDVAAEFNELSIFSAQSSNETSNWDDGPPGKRFAKLFEAYAGTSSIKIRAGVLDVQFSRRGNLGFKSIK